LANLKAFVEAIRQRNAAPDFTSVSVDQAIERTGKKENPDPLKKRNGVCRSAHEHLTTKRKRWLMKSLRFAFSLVLVLATAAFAQSDAHKTFDQLKTLKGNWEREGHHGKDLK